MQKLNHHHVNRTDRLNLADISLEWNFHSKHSNSLSASWNDVFNCLFWWWDINYVLGNISLSTCGYSLMRHKFWDIYKTCFGFTNL